MITVHHLETSRSHRILWLLEELELPYEIKRYQRDKQTFLAPSELKQVHPLGKSPIVTDGDNTVAESGAIIEYLVDTYGEGRLKPPPGSADHLRYTYWMHAAEGSLMLYLLMRLFFSNIETRAPFLIRPIAKSITRQIDTSYLTPNLSAFLDYMEAELGRSEWFAGDTFTAADIQMGYPVDVAENRIGFGNRGNLKAYLEKIRARPAYRAALDKGGPVVLQT